MRILASPRVSSWPWELMVDPQARHRFLTMARDVHVVRAARARTFPVRRRPVEPPLKLLMVMSSPDVRSGSAMETPFDLYGEKRALLAELQPLVERGLLEVEVEDRPTTERLRTRIGQQRRGFHLFHYLGHAQPRGLQLEDRNGLARIVGSEALTELLQQMPDLRLAVFAGCETARAPNDAGSSSWQGSMSLADLCARDAAPMVVGMQAVLPFGTERVFTRFFYQAVTSGQPVAEALRLARLAVKDDEFAGGTLLNWAVPCLFVCGSVPGPVADPDAEATARPQARRTGQRLGIRQDELRFVSNLLGLRQAVDVLSARTTARLLSVVGPHGSGKTAFLDRAVEELEANVVFLLVDARRLLGRADTDPVLTLCTMVRTVLRDAGRAAAPQEGRRPMDWWERLLEDVSDVRFALAIDDVDTLLADSRGESVVTALKRLTDRRGLARLAVSSSAELTTLTSSLPREQVQPVTLGPLSWDQVHTWIRRNVPVLNRFSVTALQACYYDLTRLQDWERLADRVSSTPAFDEADLAATARGLARQRTSSTLSQPASTRSAESTTRGVPQRETAEVFTAAPTPATSTPMTPGPLRLAVAGPFMAGREELVGRALTRFAGEHGMSGRVTVEPDADAVSPLARLLPLASPFDDKGRSSEEALTAWLDAALAAEADVVVLDYGSAEPSSPQSECIRRLVEAGSLVLAAGGNEGTVSYPAAEPTVLAVGALAEAGQPAGYSPYISALGKPEVYAPERLAGTPLEMLVANPDARGTSLAAIYAAAAAVLVWGADRQQRADAVHDVLLRNARPGEGGIRCLDVPAALADVRRQSIVDALQFGPLELGPLLAETGLNTDVAVPLLEAMTTETTDGDTRPDRLQTLLIRTGADGGHRYEDPASLYALQARLAQQPPGPDRDALLERLTTQAGELARRGRLSLEAIQAMWATEQEGPRAVARGAVQARPAALAPWLGAPSRRGRI